MTPLTPRSSALPSPSRGELSSTPAPQDTIVRSLADWERKQELLEWQSVNGLLVLESLFEKLCFCFLLTVPAFQKASTESVEWRRRENDRTSDISTADDSMKTVRRFVS